MEPGVFRAAFSTADAVVTLSSQPLPVQSHDQCRDVELVILGEPPRPERMIAVVSSCVMFAAERNAGGIRRFLSEAMRAGVSGFDSASTPAYAARLRAHEAQVGPIAHGPHNRPFVSWETVSVNIKVS